MKLFTKSETDDKTPTSVLRSAHSISLYWEIIHMIYCVQLIYVNESKRVENCTDYITAIVTACNSLIMAQYKSSLSLVPEHGM